MIGCIISVEDFLLALKRYREEVGPPQIIEAVSLEAPLPLRSTMLVAGKRGAAVAGSGASKKIEKPKPSPPLEAPKPQRQASAASKMPPDDRTAAATPRNGASKKEEERQKKREIEQRQGNLW